MYLALCSLSLINSVRAWSCSVWIIFTCQILVMKRKSQSWWCSICLLAAGEPSSPLGYITCEIFVSTQMAVPSVLLACSFSKEILSRPHKLPFHNLSVKIFPPKLHPKSKYKRSKLNSIWNNINIMGPLWHNNVIRYIFLTMLHRYSRHSKYF